jgi:hypothetical protein
MGFSFQNLKINFLIARKDAIYDVGFGHQNTDDQHIDPKEIKRK